MSPLSARPVAVRDPVLRFFLVAGSLYLGWYLLYEYLVHPWGVIDRALIDNLAWMAGGLLEAFGYELLPDPHLDNHRYLGVQGGHLLWIGDPCSGFGVMAVYLIFLLAYPGPWRPRLWFAALGLVVIHLLNVLRIAVLCVITTRNYELLNFNHDYTFYVVVYGCVFLLWYVWVRRFAPRPSPSPGA